MGGLLRFNPFPQNSVVVIVLRWSEDCECYRAAEAAAWERIGVIVVLRRFLRDVPYAELGHGRDVRG